MYGGGGMTCEGCAVSHGNCLGEIASSLLSCRHRYLLTPTHAHAHIEADANATCSYEELMNMQISFISSTRACVSGLIRAAQAIHNPCALSDVTV